MSDFPEPWRFHAEYSDTLGPCSRRFCRQCLWYRWGMFCQRMGWRP